MARPIAPPPPALAEHRASPSTGRQGRIPEGTPVGLPLRKRGRVSPRFLQTVSPPRGRGSGPIGVEGGAGGAWQVSRWRPPVRVTVRLGDPLWRQIGERELQVDLPDAASVGDLLGHLAGAYPALLPRLAGR